MRTYRASSLGSCTKAQVALQLGYSPLETPDQVEGWYARGRDHEDECVAAMKAAGYAFAPANWLDLAWDENQPYIELEVAGAVVTGHLDGIIRDSDVDYDGNQDWSSRVVEIKSPQSFHKWERAHKTGDYSDPLMNRYAWQISVYMAATGLEAVVACVEDGQVKTFGIEVAPHGLLEITTRVAQMERWVEQGVLPGDCSQADWPCPVAYLHEKAELDDNPAVDRLVDKYIRLGEQIKQFEVQRKEAQRLLMTAVPGEKCETASSKVTRYTTTRKTYDYEAIEHALSLTPYKLEDFITEKESESVRITRKEGGT